MTEAAQGYALFVAELIAGLATAFKPIEQQPPLIWGSADAHPLRLRG
jgi:hypothetical protein